MVAITNSEFLNRSRRTKTESRCYINLSKLNRHSFVLLPPLFLVCKLAYTNTSDKIKFHTQDAVSSDILISQNQVASFTPVFTDTFAKQRKTVIHVRTDHNIACHYRLWPKHAD